MSFMHCSNCLTTHTLVHLSILYTSTHLGRLQKTLNKSLTVRIHFWSPLSSVTETVTHLFMDLDLPPLYLESYPVLTRINNRFHTLPDTTPDHLLYTLLTTVFSFPTLRSLILYYDSIKREVKTKLIYECRYDERLKTKVEESTRLG